MKKLASYIIISSSVCIFGAAVFPSFFVRIVDPNMDIGVWNIVGLILCFLAVLVATAFLFREKSEAGIKRSVLNSLLVFALVFVAAVLISLLCGILSENLYNILKSKKALSETKGIIDIVSKGITILVLPLLVSGFWSASCTKDGTFKAFYKGLFPKPSVYVKLLAVLAVFAVIGLCISSLQLPSGINIPLNILLGIGALYLTEVFVSKEENKPSLT